MKVPAVVHVVIGHDDDGQPRIGVVVEVDEQARRNVTLVLGQRFRRPEQTAVGEKALGSRHDARLSRFYGRWGGRDDSARSLVEIPRNSIPATTPSGSSWTQTMRPVRGAEGDV